MLIRLLALYASLLITVQTSVAAGVAWEQLQINEQATFGQKEVVTQFNFVNESDGPITIKDTQTSCGCTVAELDKTLYQPGEKGSVGITFDIGQRVGKQTKRINVTTIEEGSDAHYELVLSVEIPQAIKLVPRVLTWKRNTKATTKEIKVTLHQEFSLPIESLIGQNDDANNFVYEIVKPKQANAYTIRITPKDMSAISRGRFLLGSETDEAGLLANHLIYTFLR